MSHMQPKLTEACARIAAVPSFPVLQRFPEGHGFKQWTGDDLKVLMKVSKLCISNE